ncbi:MAG: hypothetical protein ABMA26_04180 [Limisphaerales bacterium]
MTPKPTPTRALRVFIVLVMAFGVGAASYTVYVAVKARPMVETDWMLSAMNTGMKLGSITFLGFMLTYFIGSLRDAIREWPTAPQSTISIQTVRAGFREVLSEQPPESSPVWRYGMLAFGLALLGFLIYLNVYEMRDYKGERFINPAMCMVLLLNHLSASFRFSPKVTLAVRVLAWGWLLIVSAYILYTFRIRFL